METLFLGGFSVFRPDPGMIFWALVFFLTFWFMISKLAFKPIANALRTREQSIQDALDEAKRARAEVQNMKSENEKLLAQAAQERAMILKEAKEMKEQIVSEAQDKAKEEAQKIIASAKIEIDSQKNAAIAEVRNNVGGLAIEIAEQVLRKQLGSDAEQKSFVQKLVDNAKLN